MCPGLNGYNPKSFFIIFSNVVHEMPNSEVCFHVDFWNDLEKDGSTIYS
jgi:hypothetical protein